MTLRQRRFDECLSETEKLSNRREKLLIRVARLTDKINENRRRAVRLAKYLELPDETSEPVEPAPSGHAFLKPIKEKREPPHAFRTKEEGDYVKKIWSSAFK